MIVFRYIRKYYSSYLLGLIILVLVNLLSAYIPQLIRRAVNQLSSSSGQMLSSNINEIVITVLVLALVMALLRTASRWIIFGLGRQIEFDLKSDIFKHLLRFEPRFFTRYQAGDLISIMTNDVQSIRGMAGFAILNLLNTIIAFIIIVPLMYRLNAVLTLCFLLLVPIVLLSVTLVSKQIKHYQELVQEKLAEISRFIEENLSAIYIIKSYAQEKSEIQRFAKQNQGLLAYYLKLVRARTYMGPLMKVIASAGFILLLYFGATAVYDKSFAIGDFAAYSLYIERLIWPVATLGWLITIVYRARVSGARIDALFKLKPTIVDAKDAAKLKKIERGIYLPYLNPVILNEVKDPCNAAQEGSFALRAQDSKNVPDGTFLRSQSRVHKVPYIHPSGTTAITGSIGSGKSILARKLLRLEDAKPGEIYIDDTDITKISLGSLRSVISLVPQDSLLFSMSIAENILYAANTTDIEEAKRLAQLVAIDDEIKAMPQGYDTLVGERGVMLSGGQRQRIAIARAVARKPQLLILDDALSSVDAKTAELIAKNIKYERSGLATVFITHNLELAANDDYKLVLDKGAISAKS